MTRKLAAAALTCSALLVAACGNEDTEDNVVDAVPSNARAYAHVDRAADDWERAEEALRKLPALESAVRGLAARAVDVQVPGDGEAGIALLPGEAAPTVLRSDDRDAERSLGEMKLYADLVGGLPDQHFVHAYLRRGALGPIRSLDRSIAAAAVGADIDGDVMRIRLRAAHDREAGPCSFERGDLGLLDVADPKAALYVEVPSVACAIRALAERAGGGGAALGRFARAAQRRGGVSLEDELLPFLENRGAMIATPGDNAPTITLIVDDVDEGNALDLLSRLQPALIHLLGTEELGQAPSFGSAEVRGITAATARLAPGLELSYAAWDGRLVVSTSLGGIGQVRRAEGLPDSDSFESVLDDRPSEPSALLFLDLDQLLALGEQAGLAEDPRYLAVRDDLQKLRAVGAVLSREDQFTTAELTFQIP